jgi:hypothetical protein
MSQVTTITFFKLAKPSSKIWAFFMMQFGHAKLAKEKGQEFYKLMGSGRGLGFNPYPDWSVYVLLQIWSNEKEAHRFMQENTFFKTYQRKSEKSATVFMRNIASHGTWDGKKPFDKVTTDEDANQPRLILTRATIKISKLRTFWKYVPTSQKPIENAKGLVYTKGVGEWPLTQMATLSLWETETDMKAFAYGSEEHKKAIKMTRELKWYKEELFARFVPYKMIGDFEGLSVLSKMF